VKQNVKETVQNVVKHEIIDKLLYLGLLDGQAFGSWDDWRNVGLCMKWITTFEHFDTFSKINKEKYDKKEPLSCGIVFTKNTKQ